MAESVEIVPWQESSPLLEKLRQCVANSHNFRAWMLLPEWIGFRWKPFNQVFLATLRNIQSGDLISLTPLVENDFRLDFYVAGHRLLSMRFNGFLLNGNVPLFPESDEYYESLIRSALTRPSIDCLYMLGVPNDSHFWRFLKNVQTKDPEWLVYTPKFNTHRYFYIDMTMSWVIWPILE